MDPYCRLTVGHHVFETPTAVNGSKNPRWSKSFSVFLLDDSGQRFQESAQWRPKYQIFSIYNEMTFAEDDRIAWTLIQLPARVFQGSTVDDWYPLSGRQGDDKEGMISLVLTLENLPPQPQVHWRLLPSPASRPHQQQQQQQPVQITDADIGSVQEVFGPTPTLTEVIKSVLEAHGGNKDAAISALLQMS
uniref:CUE domain-containing protein n=1 Tax=Macrostomum lignano TaxID=282301 RepID=A0A1I8HGR3_9PLAT